MPDQPLSPASVLVAVNGGSSSVKFAAFASGDPPRRVLSGALDRIGSDEAALVIRDANGRSSETRGLAIGSHAAAVAPVIAALRNHLTGAPIEAVGHRIVQGGPRLVDHRRIDAALLAELRAARSLDLTHLPGEIALIDGFLAGFPDVPQVACFDSAFHRDLPRVAQLLPIPRRYALAGVRRLGFHGLSYAYLMAELRRRGEGGGRVVLAHLGSGASLAAVSDGAAIDTTMGFTPTSGLVMGTRPGDLDPGLLTHLMRTEGLTVEQFDDLISNRCGLAGVSDITGDMRELLARRASDPRAAEAVDLFCYQARKGIAAMAAALGGIDLLVFSGGIGERAPEIRAAVCVDLGFLGIELDAAANARDAISVSTPSSRVAVRVIPTDEEAMIADIARRLALDDSSYLEA